MASTIKCAACSADVEIPREGLPDRCPHCGTVMRAGEPDAGAPEAADRGSHVAAGVPNPAAPAPASAGRGPTEQPALQACLACGAGIPAWATACPYCHAAVGARYVDLRGTPSHFPAKLGSRTWNFTVRPDCLSGASTKGEWLTIPRASAAQYVVIASTYRFDVLGQATPMRFRTNDVGSIAISYFVTGTVAPRPCGKATSCLWTAIIGIFICGIILGIFAIIDSGKAKGMIDQYPRYLTGRGAATAGFVIGIIDIALSGLWVMFQMIL